MTANPDAGTVLMVAAVALPWIMAAALAAPQLRSRVLAAAPLAAVPAVALALFGEPGSTIEVPWLFKHTVLLLDQTGKVFLGCTGLLYMAAAWDARSYLEHDPVKVRFFLLLLIAMGSNLGLILSDDIPTFFASIAVMGLASAGLVSHRIDDRTRRAARV